LPLHANTNNCDELQLLLDGLERQGAGTKRAIHGEFEPGAKRGKYEDEVAGTLLGILWPSWSSTNFSAVGFRTHKHILQPVNHQIEELPIPRNTKCGEHQHAHQLSQSNNLNLDPNAMLISDIGCPSSEEIVSVRIIDIHALVKHHGNEPYLQLV